MRPEIRLRPAEPADLPAIHAIYAPEVLEGTATFELEPPDVEELGRRLAKVRALGLPWLVAELEGKVAGYAYAAPHRDRPAYRFTMEDSVYIARPARGRGIGRALLAAVVEESRRAGIRQMVAVIGDSANAGSIALHAACGFVHAGTLRAVGYKFGRWIDTILMQRAL
ncbi:N-acetyltransferase family protein [Benzoatithermus flavus]|uniref:N-acetyltransferase family protein n=1 Tax=Benzoatithermus flavus TaxID=3108223 RepID=A0ABU8XM12_9PROT